METITLSRKCESGHESGLADQELLGGVHDRDDALGELRQTLPRCGDSVLQPVSPEARPCFGYSRDPRETFGACPGFVEAWIAIWFTSSSRSSRHGTRGGPYYSNTRRHGDFVNVVTRRSAV